MDNPRIYLKRAHYVSLAGSHVNAIGAKSHALVSVECIANREKRDGKDHHITLINPREIVAAGLVLGHQKSRKSVQFIIDDLRKLFGQESTWELPVDLGPGSIRKDGAVTHFRVIHWPFGHVIRTYLGLAPAHFHVTVGFDPADIYQYKGPGTLDVLGQKKGTARDLAPLVDIASYYRDDVQFISALFKCCFKSGCYLLTIQLAWMYIKARVASVFS